MPDGTDFRRRTDQCLQRALDTTAEASSARLAPRFRRDQAGTSAIEFALLARPFFIFLLLILEVGLVFLVGQALENATQDAARLIRTGQARQSHSRNPSSKDDLRSAAGASELPQAAKIDVRVATVSVAADLSSADQGRSSWTKRLRLRAGSGDDIVVVRAFYPWPVTAGLARPDPAPRLQADIAGDRRLSPAVDRRSFRNEPF